MIESDLDDRVPRPHGLSYRLWPLAGLCSDLGFSGRRLSTGGTDDRANESPHRWENESRPAAPSSHQGIDQGLFLGQDVVDLLFQFGNVPGGDHPDCVEVDSHVVVDKCGCQAPSIK